jgi:YbbR domain-containing protein
MNILKKFDNVLTSPWFLWGISVAIAVSMWFYVTETVGSSNARREFLCRVEYRNVAPELGVRSAVREVTIEVEAPERIMDRMEYDSILCAVDLKGFSSGKYRELVRAEMPQNVRLVSVSPSRVDIELVRLAGRVFPVEVALPQDIPVGLYLEAVEVVPKEVTVQGTDRDLAKIGSVSIAPTVQELERGRELLLPVRVTQSEPFEDAVTFEPGQVRMNAALVSGLPRKKVTVNVRLSGRPSMDYAVRSVTTDPAEVLLQGPKEKLDAASAIDTETVEISQLSADQTIVVPLRVLEDEEITVVDVKSVRLSIQLEPIIAQQRLSGIPIAVEGAEDAGRKKWTVEPAVVDVTIEASPSLIETFNLGTSGLEAFVDVSSIFLRRTTLPVRGTIVSEDFKIAKIEPSTVTVSATEE